jgi:uncharacterized protein (DUF1015 family)
MASLYPFRALRPATEAAEAVSSVPYDVVSVDEARRIAAGNPLSFLHVTRSEIDLPPDIDPYASVVYERARDNFRDLRARAPLLLDDTAALYFYRLRMGAQEQTGIAGCFSVDEYEQEVIRKHERTRRDKEDDRTRHIVEVGAQTGIVFLLYRAAAEIDRLQRRVTSGEPLYDFIADDGVSHTIWRAGLEEAHALVDAFAQIPALYIADGHHRAASAARARAELRSRAARSTEALDADTFIAVAFPDNQLQILPYNRIVRDLDGFTAGQFLTALREHFPVNDGPATPRRKGEVSMYLNRRWYSIDLTGAQPEPSSRAASLDIALLQHKVLERLLRIGDVRTDPRIDFVGGARGTRALQDAVDSGAAAVAFSMHPVAVDDLMAISDEGGIMPPKSTWFEPKLRDGLMVHLV